MIRLFGDTENLNGLRLHVTYTRIDDLTPVLVSQSSGKEKGSTIFISSALA
jgi:hypothetical protein